MLCLLSRWRYLIKFRDFLRSFENDKGCLGDLRQISENFLKEKERKTKVLREFCAFAARVGKRHGIEKFVRYSGVFVVNGLNCALGQSTSTC